MVARLPVILLVLFALDIAWKMMGDMTRAMTTAIASLIKWLPAEPSAMFFDFSVTFVRYLR